MQQFKDSDLQNDTAVTMNDKKPRDEIDAMALTFKEMAQRIHLQMCRLQETDALGLYGNAPQSPRTLTPQPVFGRRYRGCQDLPKPSRRREST